MCACVSGAGAGYWLNGTWVGLTSPYGGEVNSVALSGSDVYAGGWSTNNIGVEVAGYWLNGTWVGLTNPYGAAYNAQVNSLVIVSQ